MPSRVGSLRSSITEALRDDLAAGRWLPGNRLPSEAELALRFGVNRHTVREALLRLSADGLVQSRRGAGTFVLAAPTDYPIGRRVRFGQNVRASGQTPSRDEVLISTRAADRAEADALGLALGAHVHVFEGLSLADGMPMAIFSSAFPAARFPELPKHLAATDSVTEALAACGVMDYIRASTRLLAQIATAHQAARLRISEPAALLRATSVNVDGEGRPVEHGIAWFAGDRVSLTLENDTQPP